MTNNGVQVVGEGEGFVLSAPAAVEVRLMRLYVGVFGGDCGSLCQALGSEGPGCQLDDVIMSSTEAWVRQVITIEYQDSAPGTKMTVTWKLQKAAFPTGAVHLKAVTLSVKP